MIKDMLNNLLGSDMDNEDSPGTDKNKQFMIEAIVGCVVLITLIIFAIWLLLRKELPTDTAKEIAVEAEDVRETTEPVDMDTENAVSVPDADVTDKTTDVTESDRSKGIDVSKVQRDKKLKGTGELPQVYTPGKALKYSDDDYQMPELYGYWDEYKLDAVSDIIKLERMRKITDKLKGSNDFYYYGDKDAEGRPEGKGLAIYANNTYYFGDWKAGLRSGNGMWVRIFIDEPGVVNGVDGVTWHQYSGEWKDDYPNGSGQENITYEGACDEEYAIRNVIGGFNYGFYDGEVYVMTDDRKGSSTDWYGNAKRGIFTYIGEKSDSQGKRPIWKAGDGYDTGEEDDCRWIYPSDNADFGIAGLKKG
ncbi:MAG: hypothetical protein K6E68_04035 [Lachnospiraceae bacterium]|nr:hypothetical protein [Lachnospiraceae bacterium]